MARGSRRYLQHSLAGQASPVGPDVLGQDHGAGPHVHPVLRVQHLKSTGCGAGVGGGVGLPVLPPRFPPAPAGRYLGDAQRQRRRPLREAVPPHAAPPPPPASAPPWPRRRPMAGGHVWYQAARTNRRLLRSWRQAERRRGR